MKNKNRKKRRREDVDIGEIMRRLNNFCNRSDATPDIASDPFGVMVIARARTDTRESKEADNAITIPVRKYKTLLATKAVMALLMRGVKRNVIPAYVLEGLLAMMCDDIYGDPATPHNAPAESAADSAMSEDEQHDSQ